MLGVTGSTGELGGMVARELSDQGTPQCLLVRDLSSAPSIEHSTVRRFDYADPRLTKAALGGVHTVFMVSGNDHERLAKHKAFVDTARDAGVRHIVYTSFLGAAPDAIFTFSHDHFATEEYIAQSGVHWTFLRNNLYLDSIEGFVGADDVIRGPAGEGLVSLVARADIARTAAAVLRDPAAHRGRTYNLTGREALTLPQIAAIIALHRGTHVRFHNETVAEAYASRARADVARSTLDGWISSYRAIAAGDLAEVSRDIECITGHAPMTLSEFFGARGPSPIH